MDPAGTSVASAIGGEGEKFAVGNIYSVKVITGDEFRGIVMAYDPIPNFVFFDILNFFNCLFHQNLRFRYFQCLDLNCVILDELLVITRGYKT